MSLDDARGKIEAWLTNYIESRPHSALDWAATTEFARRCWRQLATVMSTEPEIIYFRSVLNQDRGQEAYRCKIKDVEKMLNDVEK